MDTLTEQQINTIVAKVAEGLRTALRGMAGIDPHQEKKNRQKARIQAALARSEDLIRAHPHLAPILKCKAMTKTMIRRSLGGNAVNIDEALDELVAEGLVLHHPTHKLLHKAASLYQLANTAPKPTPPQEQQAPARDEQDEDRRMRDAWEAACSAPLVPKEEDDQPRNPNIPEGAYQDLQDPKSHTWRLPKI